MSCVLRFNLISHTSRPSRLRAHFSHKSPLTRLVRLPARPLVRERVTLVHVFVKGDPRRWLPMVVDDRFALRARVDAAAPLGLLQRGTRGATSARLYRDLPRPLGLAHPAAATARAPRTPFADLAISRCAWNHECNYSARAGLRIHV